MALLALRLLVVAVLVLGAGFVNFVPAPAVAAASSAEAELLWERAEAHGADPWRVLRVAQCESGFNPLAIGRAGERGLGQWHPRGAWFATPAFTVWGINILAEYRARGAEYEVVWVDADMLAWSFSPQAPAGFTRQWTCAWRV